jgi:PAS domain S-box-containing protein
MKTNEKSIVTIITVLAFIVVLIVGIATFLNLQLITERTQIITHTNRIIHCSEQVLSLTREAESSQRGFLLTADSTYLRQTYQATDTIYMYINRLDSITFSNPAQQQRIDSLRQLLTLRLSLLQQGIALKAGEDTQALAAFLTSNRSRMQMESTQALLNAIVAEEDQLLTAQHASLNRNTRTITGIIYGVIGLYFLTILFSYAAIHRLLGKREQDQSEMQALNQELSMINKELNTSNQGLAAITEELTAYNEQLTQARDELEIRVEERTATIRETNNQLVAEVSERKRGEERFRVAIQNSAITVFNQDAQLRYTWVYNPRMIGMDESVVGKTDAEIHGPENADALITIKRLAMETGQTVNREVCLKEKGKPYYYVLTVEPLLNPDKAVAGITCAAYDITEQKRTEEMLRRTLEELKKRNHELDNYVYKVSHDLRSPLVSMLGLINLMKEEADMAAIQQYITMIENRVLKSDEFIKSILSHSKTLNADIKPVQVNFPALVHECLDELKYLPGSEDVRITRDIRAGHPFYSDELRISILFKNFISNAIKYRDRQKTDSYCRISVETQPGHAVITISDNGIGIDEQYLNRIFDMFFRATEKSQGSGLGLYIVRQTLDKLAGDISVDSTLGEGTTFRITLKNLQSEPVSG